MSTTLRFLFLLLLGLLGLQSVAYTYDAVSFVSLAKQCSYIPTVQNQAAPAESAAAEPSCPDYAQAASTPQADLRPPANFIAAETGAGGIGPVLQGQRGVATAIGQIEGEGGQVLGSEITIDAGGVRARPDLLIQNADGSLSFVEVKTGGGVLTGNQQVVYPLIEQGGAVPAGANAAAAGLTPGVPLPPMPVRIIKLP